MQFVQFYGVLPPESRESPFARALAILVVDDDAAVRTTLCRSLRRRGCRVTAAADGDEGLAAVRSQPFDLVVTDVQMPGRDGVALWRAATALRPELRGRFLFCSAASLPGALAEAAATERFLAKPFDIEELWGAVRAAAGRPA